MDSEKPKHDATKTGVSKSLAQLGAKGQTQTTPSESAQTSRVTDVLGIEAAARLRKSLASASPSFRLQAALEQTTKNALDAINQNLKISDFAVQQFNADEMRRKALESLADPFNAKEAIAAAFKSSIVGFSPGETLQEKIASFYKAQNQIASLGSVLNTPNPRDFSAILGNHIGNQLDIPNILSSPNWAANPGASANPSKWLEKINGPALSITATDMFKKESSFDANAAARESIRMLSSVSRDPLISHEEYESQRQRELLQQQADNAQQVAEAIQRPYREKVQREEKNLELLRRSVEIAEAQITETKEISKEAKSISNHAKDLSEIASAASAESKIESRNATSKSWLAIIISLAALLLTAWPFLKERIDGL